MSRCTGWLLPLSALAALSIAYARPLAASTTGLLVMPTADLVGGGNYVLEVDFFGKLPKLGEHQRFIATELGIGNRFEFGVDSDVSRHPAAHVFLDAKCLLTAGRIPIAAGVCAVGRGLKPCPFIVGMRELGKARMHLGTMQIGGSGRLIAGVDTGFHRTWTLMADFTSGHDGLCSVGANCQFNSCLGVGFGLVFANADGSPSLTVQIAYTGHLGR